MDEKIEMLHKICKALMEELEEYSKKIERVDGMSAGDLEAVDKLSHALKSIKTTIAMMEASEDKEGYSEYYRPYWGSMSYARDTQSNPGNSNRNAARGNSSEGGMGYARRGRMNNPMGRNQYSREGGYSYAEEFQSALEEAINAAPNEHAREKLQQIMHDV